jgi:hypothetical protein
LLLFLALSFPTYVSFLTDFDEEVRLSGH